MKSSGANFEQLTEQIREFCAERDWDQFHGPKDLAIGLVTESAELLELFRFLSETQGQTLIESAEGRTVVGEELADVLFFLLRFAQRFNFNLPSELERKMVKNAEKYPAAEFRGRNHKYNRSP